MASALLTTESFTDIGFKSPSWIDNNDANHDDSGDHDNGENHHDSENHNSGDQVPLVH